MGIPSYFSFIVKNHKSIIKKYGEYPIKVNNLYLDCNSIIYDAVNTISFKDWKEDQGTKASIIIRWAIHKIEEYIFTIKPDSNIFIAFDGVAPVAKLEQQRGRRYKSWYQNTVLHDIHQGAKPDPWNTSAITPGTEFMNELNASMKSHFKKTPSSNVNVIVSGSDDPGEGEHKMFDFIRQHKEKHLDWTTVIYGLDADLIICRFVRKFICLGRRRISYKRLTMNWNQIIRIYWTFLNWL